MFLKMKLTLDQSITVVGIVWEPIADRQTVTHTGTQVNFIIPSITCLVQILKKLLFPLKKPLILIVGSGDGFIIFLRERYPFSIGK